MPNPINIADLGRRVRAARTARRLTLEEVVSRADFTVSWLSKLENGQLTPSLEGLVKLADVLECGVEALVAGLSIPPQCVVVKAGEGRVQQPARERRSGIVAEHLADQWRNRAMNPLMLHISGSGNRGTPDNHNGERFLYVVEGELKVEYGDDLILLKPGDSIYIYAAIPHTLMPAGRDPVKVLSIAYEPSDGGSPAVHSGRGAVSKRKR